MALRDIDSGGSRLRLRESFIKKELGNPKDKNSQFYKALTLGWLNDVGIAAESPTEKVYAFFHPTFEEYFAALAIDDWDFFLPREHIDRPVVDKDNPGKYKPYRIFEPQWKEVILLWLGREDEKLREQKEQFIQALVEFQDEGNDLYWYRAYFLAATGIAEFGDCSRADEILTQIVKWGFGYFDIKKQEWVRFFDPIAEGVRAVLRETDRTKAIQALVELIQNSQDEHIRRQAAASLGEIDSGNRTAIQALVELIQNSPSIYIHRQAAESLGKIASGNPTAIQALVHCNSFLSKIPI